MTNKEKYKLFCEEEVNIPIFSQAWWLDIVCDGNWDVILVEKGGQICASFPYFYSRTRSGLFILMPPLTQKMGVYIKYPKNQSPASKLQYEKELCNSVIDQLPQYDFITFTSDYLYTNWLPFYWHGFTQTTRYTYVVNDLSCDVFSNFAPAKRTDIRKAQKCAIIKYDLSPENFIAYYKRSLKKQGKLLSYSEDMFLCLCRKCISTEHGRIIYAVSSEDESKIMAAIFYIYDNSSIYSLVTAFDPDYRKYAASSLLFYQIMLDYKDSGLKFDFEGSMIPNIEQSYNKFGTLQTPYFSISKQGTRYFRIKQALKIIINELHKH